MKRLRWRPRRSATALLVAALTLVLAGAAGVRAQVGGPRALDPNLDVRTVTAGLSQPTAMAFLGASDMLVLEKATGRVRRVIDGVIQGTVLDLAVNSGSERGLLGIALHPAFPRNPGVYLYWTETRSGLDNAVLSDTTLLGNRVDRFVWDGSSLRFDRNIIRLRAIQQDAGQPERGNHDGGVITFGPPGKKAKHQKLFIVIGDVGRRGQLQNLPDGPFGPGVPDDQFGGPEPDDAHLTGAILRLNDDGSIPRDNPFFRVGGKMGGEVGENVQKIFAYGLRNSFGLAFHPRGRLWDEQNGDDSFTELNQVEPGTNMGWIQVMGPVERISQFKQIETGQGARPTYRGLQQIRWPPERIADSEEEALDRLFDLEGSEYSDPEFSWKYEVAPAAIGFMFGRGLGKEYENDLFVGAARTVTRGGHIFHFDLNGGGNRIKVDDNRLEDGVADNLDKNDLTESESLLFGENFGVGTDIETGPNGNLFVVSLSNGAIYEIFRRR